MAELAHYTGTHFGVFEVEHAPDGVRLRDTALDIHPGEMRASLEELQRSEPRIRRSVLCGARIVDWIADQVISVETRAWFSPVENGDVTCAHGNPNVLTRDVGCSRLSQGPSPNSALVSAELFTASLPENTARKAPRFV
jgi:hypothetical protein